MGIIQGDKFTSDFLFKSRRVNLLIISIVFKFRQGVGKKKKKKTLDMTKLVLNSFVFNKKLTNLTNPSILNNRTILVKKKLVNIELNHRLRYNF